MNNLTPYSLLVDASGFFEVGAEVYNIVVSPSKDKLLEPTF